MVKRYSQGHRRNVSFQLRFLSISILVLIVAIVLGLTFLLSSYLSLTGLVIYENGKFDVSADFNDWTENEVDADGDFMDNSPDTSVYLGGSGSLKGETVEGAGSDWSGEYLTIDTPSLSPGLDVYINFSWRKSYISDLPETSGMSVYLKRPDSSERLLWSNNALSGWDTWTTEWVDASTFINQNGIYEIQLRCNLKNSDSASSSAKSICWYDEFSLEIDNSNYGQTPAFLGFLEIPLTNTEYSQDKQYKFRVNVTDTDGSVWLNFNGVDYSAQSIQPNNFEVVLSDLSAGTYTYYWRALGSGIDRLPGSSESFDFTIEKSEEKVYMLLNDVRRDIIVGLNEEVNLNALFPDTTATGSITLYLDNVVQKVDSSNFATIVTFDQEGTYNLSVSYTGDENHSSSWETNWITVSKEAETSSSPQTKIISPVPGKYPAGTTKIDFKINSESFLDSCQLYLNSEIGPIEEGYLGLSENLELLYHLNSGSSIGDSSSNANSGIAKGNPSAVIYGKIKGGWKFSSSNYIETSKELDISSEEGFSTSLWIKLDNRIIDSDQVILKTIQISPAQGFLISYIPSTNNDEISFQVGDKSFVYSQAADTLFKEWSHLVLTYSSSGDTRAYLNGEILQIINLNPKIFLQSKVLLGGDGVKSFDGFIDEVAIWNNVFSQPEIKSLYENQKGINLNLIESNSASYTNADMSIGKYRAWFNCKYVSGAENYALPGILFEIPLVDEPLPGDEEEEQNETNLTKLACPPRWKCTGWSSCEDNLAYDVNQIIRGESEITVSGQKDRVCEDTHGCEGPKIEKEECSLAVPIKIKQRSWCGDDYLEIYEKDTDKIVGRLKTENLESFENRKLNVGFVINEFSDYCHHCYNNVRDFDETQIDCGGLDCPVCLKEVWWKQTINILLTILEVLIISGGISYLFYFLYLKDPYRFYKKKKKYSGIPIEILRKDAIMAIMRARRRGYQKKEIREIFQKRKWSRLEMDDLIREADRRLRIERQRRKI